MTSKIVLTTREKIMNMPKVGIVSRLKLHSKNGGNYLENKEIRGSRAIHYAYSGRQSGSLKARVRPAHGYAPFQISKSGLLWWLSFFSKCRINDLSLAGLTGLCSK